MNKTISVILAISLALPFAVEDVVLAALRYDAVKKENGVIPGGKPVAEFEKAAVAQAKAKKKEPIVKQGPVTKEETKIDWGKIDLKQILVDTTSPLYTQVLWAIARADVDESGYVSVEDLIEVAKRFGTRPVKEAVVEKDQSGSLIWRDPPYKGPEFPDPNFDAKKDPNGDGKIDIMDLKLVIAVMELASQLTYEYDTHPQGKKILRAISFDGAINGEKIYVKTYFGDVQDGSIQEWVIIKETVGPVERIVPKKK